MARSLNEDVDFTFDISTSESDAAVTAEAEMRAVKQACQGKSHLDPLRVSRYAHLDLTIDYFRGAGASTMTVKVRGHVSAQYQ